MPRINHAGAATCYVIFLSLAALIPALLYLASSTPQSNQDSSTAGPEARGQTSGANLLTMKASFAEKLGYDIIADMDYNMGSAWDLMAPTHGWSIEQCLLRCSNHSGRGGGCGAVVRQGDDCYYKISPAVVLVKKNHSVSFVRRVRVEDSSLQQSLREDAPRGGNYVLDRDFSQRIAFGMLTTRKYLRTRAAVALSTWLCPFHVLLLLEIEPAANETFQSVLQHDVPAACQVVHHAAARPDGTPPRPYGRSKHAAFMPPTDDSINAAWKDLPLLRLLVERYLGDAEMDWFVIIDDDTFIFTHNLNIELSTFHRQECGDKAKKKVIGVLFEDESERRLLYPQGGAGIIISRDALQAMSAMRFTCIDRCKQWAGDIRLGCCVRLAAVTLAPSENLWSRTPFIALGHDHRRDASAYPVSFHQMRNAQWVVDIFRWADHLTGPQSCSPLNTIPAASQGTARRTLKCVEMCAGATNHNQPERRKLLGDRRSTFTSATPLPWRCFADFVKELSVDSTLFHP